MGKEKLVVLKDATIVQKGGREYLFGTVVEDDRFEIGHRILTSDIVEKNLDEKRIVTYSGTLYSYVNLMTNEELVTQLKETEKDKVKLDYILTIFNI